MPSPALTSVAYVLDHLALEDDDEHLQGSVRFVNDAANDTYYVEAGPNYNAGRMDWLVEHLETREGLTMIDPDDEPGVPMPDGSIRIYFERKE